MLLGISKVACRDMHVDTGVLFRGSGTIGRQP
jgi:hypothetical protein